MKESRRPLRQASGKILGTGLFTTWTVFIKTEIVSSIELRARSAGEAQRMVEDSLDKDDRDPIKSAVSDSLRFIDEILEQDVYEVTESPR